MDCVLLTWLIKSSDFYLSSYKYCHWFFVNVAIKENRKSIGNNPNRTILWEDNHLRDSAAIQINYD